MWFGPGRGTVDQVATFALLLTGLWLLDYLQSACVLWIWRILSFPKLFLECAVITFKGFPVPVYLKQVQWLHSWYKFKLVPSAGWTPLPQPVVSDSNRSIHGQDSRCSHGEEGVYRFVFQQRLFCTGSGCLVLSASLHSDQWDVKGFEALWFPEMSRCRWTWGDEPLWATVRLHGGCHLPIVQRYGKRVIISGAINPLLCFSTTTTFHSGLSGDHHWCETNLWHRFKAVFDIGSMGGSHIFSYHLFLIIILFILLICYGENHSFVFFTARHASAHVEQRATTYVVAGGLRALTHYSPPRVFDVKTF